MIAFHIMCSATYNLLVIGKDDIIRLLFEKCAMSFTNCWS